MRMAILSMIWRGIVPPTASKPEQRGWRRCGGWCCIWRRKSRWCWPRRNRREMHMRAEPPDQLTTQVWQMLADACVSSLSTSEVIEELTLSLRYDLAYLRRRARLGRHTSYDPRLERSLVARARAIVLLQGMPEGSTTEN